MFYIIIFLQTSLYKILRGFIMSEENSGIIEKKWVAMLPLNTIYFFVIRSQSSGFFLRFYKYIYTIYHGSSKFYAYISFYSLRNRFFSNPHSISFWDLAFFSIFTYLYIS